MAKEIPLTQGKVTIVDDEDYDWLIQWKWHAHKGGKNYYAARGSRKKDGEGKPSLIYMHTEIIGEKIGYEVDHGDGNGLNNRRNNLKHVTRRQNMQNRHDYKTSKYPGVSWNCGIKRWQATVSLMGKQMHLGYYHTPDEAFKVYCNALEEMSLPLPEIRTG